MKSIASSHIHTHTFRVNALWSVDYFMIYQPRIDISISFDLWSDRISLPISISYFKCLWRKWAYNFEFSEFPFCGLFLIRSKLESKSNSRNLVNGCGTHQMDWMLCFVLCLIFDEFKLFTLNVLNWFWHIKMHLIGTKLPKYIRHSPIELNEIKTTWCY